MKLQSAGSSHVGRRPNNEDNFCLQPALGLFAVADGMGGYEGGEVASELAVTAIAGFYRRNAEDDDATWPFATDRSLSFGENLIRVAVKLAHAEICARKQGRNAHMGSTVAALHFAAGQAVIGHVGDSRVYRLRGGELRQLTRDHSLYAELVASGATDLPDRAACGFGNVITRALGMPGAEPDVGREQPRAGDLYLLCTDGLYEALDEKRLAELLGRSADLEAACSELVEEAYRLGSRDNITAVLVRVVER